MWGTQWTRSLRQSGIAADMFSLFGNHNMGTLCLLAWRYTSCPLYNASSTHRPCWAWSGYGQMADTGLFMPVSFEKLINQFILQSADCRGSEIKIQHGENNIYKTHKGCHSTLDCVCVCVCVCALAWVCMCMWAIPMFMASSGALYPLHRLTPLMVAICDFWSNI